MSDHLQEIEARGKDVEIAIENGLAKLRAKRGDVIVEVIDEGSRGLLGIGSREAVVRLKRMLPTGLPASSPPAPKKEAAKVEVETTAVPPLPQPPSLPRRSSPPVPVTETEAAQKEVAAEIVQTLLDKMQISATVTTTLSEPDDLTGEQIDVIEINGDDLGVLIGPRGDTLNTLQYLVRLMVSHRLHERVNFVIDVQGYRQRRQQALASLANRMAKKAIQRGQPIGLEPMPPHERRVIHMTLRQHDEVYTESSGEGNRRKVRIIPK
jgi:spoIIIJ-associated protein